LDITRIRQQKLNMEMADVDLVAVVQSAIDMTALSANERGVHVRLHSLVDSAPLCGDRVRLLQVVWNLLSNAIKFTEPDGEIDVRLERHGSDARLSVIDTGVGVSSDFAPHVFELYRQASQASSHRPGLGIGLAIVAQIVKLHKGTVCVESRGVGHGSTFIVTIPLEFPAEAEGAPGKGRRSSKQRRADGRRVKNVEEA
ncbi:MAG TPA: HAMP domain-containing sensor histidine kinase, partial [Thermoanaerobaculia bacterium]|nr:HAMP domain-containing sensor histidine kinase [Thermoanaerobaculia bacterium]